VYPLDPSADPIHLGTARPSSTLFDHPDVRFLVVTSTTPKVDVELALAHGAVDAIAFCADEAMRAHDRQVQSGALTRSQADALDDQLVDDGRFLLDDAGARALAGRAHLVAIRETACPDASKPVVLVCDARGCGVRDP
jgi:hypothetical protein